MSDDLIMELARTAARKELETLMERKQALVDAFGIAILEGIPDTAADHEADHQRIRARLFPEKKPHWTQRPENKARLKKALAKGRRTRKAKG